MTKDQILVLISAVSTAESQENDTLENGSTRQYEAAIENTQKARAALLAAVDEVFASLRVVKQESVGAPAKSDAYGGT